VKPSAAASVPLLLALTAAGFGEARAKEASDVSKAPANASATNRVSLAIPACATPAFDASALLKLLRVELADEHFELRSDSRDNESSDVHVALSPSSCDRGGAEISIDITHTDMPLRVSLAEVAEAARARTLALVIAEALRGRAESSDASSAASRRAPESGAAASALTSSTEDEPGNGIDALYARSDPYSSAPRIDVGVMLQARVLSQNDHVLLGAELGARVQVWRAVRAALELSYATGERTALDVREIDWWNAATGLDVSLTELPRLRLGGRVSLGRVLLLSTEDQRVQDTLVPMAGIRMGFGLPMGEHASLESFGEGMHTLNGLAAPWDSAFGPDGVRGWVVSWGLGVAIQP
jgi:hypothetical protein